MFDEDIVDYDETGIDSNSHNKSPSIDLEKKEEPKSQDEVIELNLQLGDVIQITNPVNELLNEQVFIIDYIDNSKAYLINTDTLNRIKLKISENGVLGDGNITKIEIFSRADSPSYARQNGLIPGKWINIYFGDPDPAIIVGEITNLEEDMIEVRTTDKDIIYINFDYKGIPENLPIESIEIREKPTAPLTAKKEEEEEDESKFIEAPEELEKEKAVIEAEKLEYTVPIKDVKDQLREFIVKADQIVFGDEELGPVKQYVDVSTKSQRYSIESQVSDLLDDLLSTVPNSQRTPKVLNNIHIIIERFKQLRSTFSEFDKYGNVDSIIVKEATYKPLKTWLKKFNQILYWILPVVKNNKKIYNAENVDEENNDIISLDLTDDLKNMNELISNYKSNNLPVDINRYSGLYSDIVPYFTPFTDVDAEDNGNIIIFKEVNSDLNVVIDNLEDMYSSVFSNNMVRNRRFVVSKYNMSGTKLDITDSTSSKMTTVRVPVSQNDTMAIKSIITLPEPTIRFSKINLPGTDILTKANLNEIFLNYWELLKKKTNITNVFIDSMDIEFDDETFVSGIRNYVMNLPEDVVRNNSRIAVYNAFLNAVVPKIRIIFNLMKKYIKGKLSIVDVVSYLEPFLIYSDDLTFKQYQDITEFIDEKISDYNKNMIEFSRIFKILSTVKQATIIKTKAFSAVEIISSKLRDEVFDTGYQFDKPEETFTNSEILRKITIKDYSKLYTTALAYQNVSLMFPKDIEHIFSVEEEQLTKKLNKEEESDKCKTMVIAKMYTSPEYLKQDNDVTIYFDKKYDKTNYGLMEEINKNGGYAEDVIRLEPDKLKERITNDQMKRNMLSEPDAKYLAETLIDGHKKVIDGQYAIVYNGYKENYAEESDYYIRQNDKWVLDKSVPKKNGITDEASILCDLQEKCINQVDDKCESLKSNELNLQTGLLNDIISEFDTKYKMSKDEFAEQIKNNFNYFMSIMPVVSKIETNFLLKYNNQRYNLGANIDKNDEHQITSPYSKLLDIILGQKDFVKKQYDTIRFVDKFTRTASPVLSSSGSIISFEDIHWLYCIKTGAKLLPAFKKQLAAAFILTPEAYQVVLEHLKSTIGQMSDDGDKWTDKYTGWELCSGDFSTEEGFDEGFKVSTRAVMEDAAGNKILSASENQKTIKYITAETIMINNIINALSVAMGINLESQKEFIINCVIETIKNTVESETDYKEKVKAAAAKGKALPSYRDFFNTSLLFYTFGMYLIAIQTSIPSVKTRKTHPGCVRSFVGYPYDGQGDLSSLTYLACIIYDIRQPSEPWNVLKKTNAEKIQTRIKAVIDDLLLANPDVQRKFAEKTEYLLTNPTTEIPEEHDIAKWSDFLPPLVPIKMKHLVNISDEFKRSLVNDLRTGAHTQREKILVVESKIIQFSLAIQEKIQNIVKQHKVLLHTANNEPYLENACCDSKENETTINYFKSRSNDIEEYNKIVQKLSDMLDDIRANTESCLFYSNINTKNMYPPISNKFDEKTIYMAFIFYCKFKSLIPIPEDLIPICTDKPDSELINPSDTIERIIQKLKEDGRNYSNEQFLRLLQLISRENIINIELDNPVISCVAKLSKLIEAIYDENNDNEIIEQSLRDLIANAIDTFNIATEESTKEVRALNDFLVKNNEEMSKELIDFVQKNSGSNVTRKSIKKFIETINDIAKWSYDDSHRNEDIKISDDATYNIANFYKTFIDNFINVFPNIILNKVNYDNTSIPNYYGFSKNHANKLKKFIADYFEKLKPFYGVPTLNNILSSIQKMGKNMVKIADATPSFSSIKNKDTMLRGVIDERTSRYLFEYYLLRTLLTFIILSDEDDMIVTEVKKEYEVDDLFSVEYIEDVDTRVDLTYSTRVEADTRVLTGNKKELKQKTAELLVAFIDILREEKNTIDTNYEEIQDRVFKLKEREKDMVTDRLKAMTDEQRDVDTVMKITKQGEYSKGMQKGLTILDKDFYDEEQELRDEMLKAERKIRAKNKDANDDNIDSMIEDYLAEQREEREIDEDVYDISYLNEAFYDGNFDGIDAPEEEEDDYMDYY